jgi:hypothetical protein
MLGEKIRHFAVQSEGGPLAPALPDAARYRVPAGFGGTDCR